MDDYQQQLKDERWIALSQQIKERDYRMCTQCNSTRKLKVHHKVYIRGRKAWEYAPAYLITLCGECHELFHQLGETKVLDHGDLIIECFASIARDVAAIRSIDRREALNG